MSERESALLLLEMAEKDLRALNGMQDPTVFAEEIFGFHAQQAAEKCLKAWIAALGEQYPLTHNLAILLAQLERLGVEVGAYWDLVDFNPLRSAVSVRNGGRFRAAPGSGSRCGRASQPR